MSRVVEWVALASRALRRYPPLDGRVTYEAAAVAAIEAAAAAHLDARVQGRGKAMHPFRRDWVLPKVRREKAAGKTQEAVIAALLADIASEQHLDAAPEGAFVAWSSNAAELIENDGSPLRRFVKRYWNQ